MITNQNQEKYILKKINIDTHSYVGALGGFGFRILKYISVLC